MKAVVYARYSSDNQREESIEAQIRAINEYSKQNNIQIMKIYTDEAKSATSDDRPQFLQMIKDSAMGLWSGIIVHKLDRFARNRYDSAFYKKKLKENGVRLISVLEHLDDSPESIILESVLEGMAEYYSKNLSREVMKGMKETALQCKHTGGKPPLGYDVTVDKTYIINPNESKIVKLIFQLYADGHGYNNIINTLNDKGYKTKTGRVFGKNSIHDILRNEKYNGVYVFNKSSKKENGKRNSHKSKSNDEIIRIENGMPKIISDYLWHQVEKRMDMNKTNRASNSSKVVYLLSGLIYCGKCGGAMTGNRRYAGRNKTLYMTYECSTRKRTHSCDMKAINKEYVENLVINELHCNLFTKSGLEMTINKIHEYAKKQNIEISHDIKEYEKELYTIKNQIDNILTAVADGFYNPSMKNKMNELESQKSLLSIRLDEAKRELSLSAPKTDMIRKYLEKDSDIKEKSPEEQRAIIHTYVKKITINENTIVTSTIVNFAGGGEGN